MRVCSWCGRPDQDWLDSLKPLGSALKPAHEPIIVARKPLGGTVAANALKFGTGALNIDACRVGVGEGREREGEESAERRYTERGSTDFAPTLGPRGGDAKGRWPANLVLSHAEECGDLCVEGCPVASLNEQSGERRGGGYPEQRSANSVFNPTSGGSSGPRSFGDSGGAARFFFTSKTSRAERDAGLDETFAVKPLNWSSGEQSPGTFQSEGTEKAARNNHPTVKPIDLMRWLCRLVTPEGGLILDPFAGSGTTGCAAVLEGFRFVGYEKQEEYYRIAVARIKHWSLFEGNDTERALASSVRTQTRLEAGQIGLLDKEA